MVSASQRRKIILERVNRDGYTQVSDLAAATNVTPATIRADLTILEKEGLLCRVHGSAMSNNTIAHERTTIDKRLINADVKSRIGKAAAEIVSDGDSIFLAAGSTVVALSEQLGEKKGLNVFTSSVQLAAELCSKSNMTIHLMGGIVHYESLSVRGEYADQLLGVLNCNILFIGADGIDEDRGITCSTVEEAIFTQKCIRCCEKVILLCDSSKFGRRGIGRICPIKRLDVLVTDSGISQHNRQLFEEAGVKVVIV